MRSQFIAALLLVAAAFAPSDALAQAICPGQTGEPLLTCIRSNYTPTSTRSYSGARNALFGSVDNIGGTVEGVYTGATITVNPNGSNPHSEAFGKGFNTEHSFPQSKGTSNEPARADLHHLFASVANVNSARGSLPFAEIDDSQTDDWYRGTSRTSSAPPLSERDEYSERGNGRFEPRESREGDIARAIFYIATIYEGTVSSSFFEQQKDDLLVWHGLDPATEADVARSGRAKAVQGNDNPFVLDPTLANRAFGDGTGGAASAEIASFDAAVSDRMVQLTWQTSSETDNDGFGVEQRLEGGAFAEIAFVDGAGTTSAPQQYTYTTGDLAPGSYEFRLRLDSGTGSSSFSEIATAFIEDGPPTATVVEDFAGSANGPEVTLTWRTTSELDNASFGLDQRLAASPTYGEVGTIEGAGTTGTPQDYSITLTDMTPGDYVFRLRRTDTSGGEVIVGETSVTVKEAQTSDGFGVFISEINEPSEFAGEFVELYNAGTSAVDLDGWTLTQTNSDKLTTLNAASLQNGSLTLAPGAYAVVGRGSDSQFGGIFGSVPATYFSEGNSEQQGAPQINGDEIYVLADASGDEIDTFAPPGGFARANDRYQRVGYPDTPGTSADAWVGDSTIGTPGAANDRSPIPTAVEQPTEAAFTLGAPFPNPFALRAAFSLEVAAPQLVEAAAYDMLGRRVAELYSGPALPGAPLTLVFDAQDLASGVYLVRVAGESFAASRTVTLAR